MRAYHTSVAAEAFAAAVFSQAGFDVSVQYGPNQPEYDLVVSAGTQFARVSVKGSQNGSWLLATKFYRSEEGYPKAISRWLESHRGLLLYCLVQFRGVPLGDCPRTYLATPQEIALELRKARNGIGGTVLWEDHGFTRGVAAGTVSQIPKAWKFSAERLRALLSSGAQHVAAPVPSRVPRPGRRADRRR